MKRFLAVFLIMAVLFSFSACGKSKAVLRVEEKIEEIGEVGLDSEKDIKSAERVYNALSDNEKEDVGNYEELVSARAEYDELVLEDAAVDAEEAIDAIGEVTVESGDAIENAREAYEATDEEAKPYVSNYDKLEEAEVEYKQLRINTVVSLIDGIGTITIESGSKITAAREAYDDLPEELKTEVTNATALTTAESEYRTLCQNTADELLDGMTLDEDEVRRMKFYYPDAFPYYRSNYWLADERSFVLPYIGMDDDDVWLRLVCNYTGDDWIFFEKITFAIDDERYYKTFSYFDVTRDNDSGDVWECVDISVGEEEIDLLWMIVNSEKTIVRFEGDDHIKDIEISQTDKNAIKEVLITYEVLQQIYG